MSFGKLQNQKWPFHHKNTIELRERCSSLMKALLILKLFCFLFLFVYSGILQKQVYAGVNYVMPPTFERWRHDKVKNDDVIRVSLTYRNDTVNCFKLLFLRCYEREYVGL